MKYILLHGLRQTSASWNSTIVCMEKRNSILCPNLADWIQNKTPSFSNLYRSLEEYCEYFIEPLNLCGISLGGMLALRYGMEHPEKVKSLALMDVQCGMSKRSLEFQKLKLLAMPNSSFQEEGFEKKECITIFNSMRDWNFEEKLNQMQCPVFIICGGKDKRNKSVSLQLKERIPGAEFLAISDAGCEVNIDAPKELGEELEAFFNFL